MLKFGASNDDVCTGCGWRGHVAWISGELALVLESHETQPRVVGPGDLSHSRRPTTTTFLDLYLCGTCLAAASALTPTA
ncbi:MAG: hypothetical protein JOZ65_27280 [Chloroflexi bacterium]|nr:hypothetical protein [Chloroflexota bacterium]